MDVPAQATALLESAGVRFAYLFGSRAAATHTADSDADIAVLVAEPLDLLAESQLALDLAAALNVPKVDLVDLRRAPLRLLGRILGQAIVIHGRNEPERIEFEVRTRGLYFDFLPQQREHRRAFLARVAAEGLHG